MPHRLGRIIACSAFLEAIPRSAMIAAIRRHAADGTLASDHECDGKHFRLQTDDQRQTTIIRLKD